MADVTNLSGLVLPGEPTVATEAASMAYVDNRVGNTVSDVYFYGDKFSTLPRVLAANSARTHTLGQIIVSGGMAADTATVTTLRFNCATAAAGTGTFNAAVYFGSTSNSITRVATITQQTALATGLREFTLSNNLNIGPYQLYWIAFLTTGFSTNPILSSTTGGGPQSAITNAVATRQLGANSTTTNNTALPTSMNLSSGYSGIGALYWFALA